MSFDENGFLGEQIESIMFDIYNQNKDLFDYIKELNSFAQRFKFKINVHSNKQQEILAACTFIKLLNSFQSIFILSRKGLESDSRSILRVAHEELFILKKLCEDADFAKKFPALDLLQRKKILNIIKNDKNDMIFDKELKENFKPEVIKIMLERLDQEIENVGLNEIKAETLAKEVGLLKMYNAYRVLSDDVHTKPRSLEKHFKVCENGEMMLNCAPITENLVPTLISAYRLLFFALESIMKLFKIESDEEFLGLNDRGVAIMKDAFRNFSADS